MNIHKDFKAQAVFKDFNKKAGFYDFVFLRQQF